MTWETGLSKTFILHQAYTDIYFRFCRNSRKVKFVVSGMCPDSDFPVKFTDFQVSLLELMYSIPSLYSFHKVVHHYLHSAKKGFQTRLRKRVRNGRATFTFTVRKPEMQGQVVEVKQPISQRDYNNLLSHRYYLVLKIQFVT